MPDPSGATPVFGFPYPLETDQPDPATALQLLAEAVETQLDQVVKDDGTLSSLYNPTASFVTFESTNSLAIGTWLVIFTGSVQIYSGGSATLRVQLGSASGTILGPADCTVSNAGANTIQLPVPLVVLAVVTAAGTLAFQAEGSACQIEASPQTGYVAVQLGSPA